ncbi:MAG: phosphoribosylanthranilate isomerase [Candidatus Krumholzibacteriia bacterium]
MASPDLPVKVCGLTRLADARLAWELGAAALGFVFHPASPRALTPDAAAALRRRLPREAFCVGVFVDRPVAEVNAVAARVGLDAVQLHGGESAADCAAVRPPVIKALRPAPGGPAAVPPSGHPAAAFLLDAWDPARPGGSGRRADWQLAGALAAGCRLILAGGLTPDTVAAAAAAVRPAGLDLCSGLERAPGVKDPARLRALFTELRPGGRPCLLA